MKLYEMYGGGEWAFAIGVVRVWTATARDAVRDKQRYGKMPMTSEPHMCILNWATASSLEQG
jgi:hypothetical protein